MPRSSSCRPDDLGLVVPASAGGELGLLGVVAGERLALRAVVVAAGELLDEDRAGGAGVEHAPAAARRALEADEMHGAGGVAVAGGQFVRHGGLLAGEKITECAGRSPAGKRTGRRRD